MRKSTRINIVFFIALFICIVSCKYSGSSLSEGEKDFYIYMTPSLSVVFVSSSLDVKAIKYCFSNDDKCSNYETVSDFKVNKNKNRNIFQLSNKSRFSNLYIESTSVDEKTLNQEKSTGYTQVTIEGSIDDGSIKNEVSKATSEEKKELTENESKEAVVKKRKVQLYTSRSTKGSTNKTDQKYESTFSDSKGSSAPYKVSLPSSYSDKDPAGLIIYLHGDSASDYSNGWLFNPVATYVNKLNIIAVNVRSPTNSTTQWWSNPDVKGRYLHELIENRLFRDYNINKDRIYFTGTSGGSQFITGMFVSRYVGDYGGGAIPVCGGADIYSNGIAGGMNTDITNKLKKDFRIFYYTGTGDFLYNNGGVGVLKSKEHYSSLGVTVGGEHPEGVGHCQKDVTPAKGVEKAFAFFEKERIKELSK